MTYRTKWRVVLAAVLLMSAAAAHPAFAQEPNLTYKYDPAMTYPVTPTNLVPAPIPVTVPVTLPGNSTSIYFNLVGQNNGAASTPTHISGTFKVDGENPLAWHTSSAVNAGATYFNYNNGATNIRGGRHTLEVVHDDPDLVSESNETDNAWAHQFVFTPYVLTADTPKDRGTPPNSLGGTFSIIDGSPIDYNCDGFRFSNSGWWNAVVMYALDNSDDYDLDIFAPSTGAENGFINSITGSYALAGQLDAVIVNSNTVPVQDFDVGVTKVAGSDHFVIEHVVGGSAWVGSDLTVSFGIDEYLKIWDTYVGDTGWVTVAATDSSISGIEFRVGWFDHDATVTDLASMSSSQGSDARGEIRLHRDFTTVGYYGLVLYRDPGEGSAAVDLTLRVEPTPPDLSPGSPHFWHSELVPTPVPIVPGYHAALPDTLHGYMPQTHINFRLDNGSPTPSPQVDVAVYQDGMNYYFIPYVLPGLPAYGSFVVNDASAFEYPGGRHTLTLDIDHTEAVHEISEYNNVYGEQYCWSPLGLSPGQQYSNSHPGYLMGGFESVKPTETFYYNCDGYRLMTGNSYWEGMVLTQGPNSDYDLSVHWVLDGVKDGFDDYLAYAEMLAGQTDYVLFNNSLLQPGTHDVGVENLYGEEPYTIEAVESVNLPVPIGGHYGPYIMPISNMLHLHNTYLEQDMYAFRLDNITGGADWSIALHPQSSLRPSRLDVVSNGYSNQNGPGAPEWFTVDIATPGWYCLAVCKATPFDFDLQGTYSLTILRGVSDVEDDPELPKATALAGVHPNPFNPLTTISYELAAPAVVELTIYDVKGARVRQLVGESMPPGRHESVWNGEDDAGQRVASGVYMVRFKAGSHRDVKKVVMVK